jgi:hypothetical protein
MKGEGTMTIPDQTNLLQLMDETRSNIEKIIPQIDPHLEIYPGWTIREVLAHITGWDDSTVGTLRAHVEGKPLSQPKIRDFDEYNALSVSCRAGLAAEQVVLEWRSTRKVLRTMIEELPEDKFNTSMAVPWGGKSTVSKMMEMFCKHEDSHTKDIRNIGAIK